MLPDSDAEVRSYFASGKHGSTSPRETANEEVGAEGRHDCCIYFPRSKVGLENPSNIS